MAIYCGIDLGTTNTLITCYDEEGAIPLEPNGNRFMPSCIFATPDIVYVGNVAKNHRKLDPTRYIASSKRFMPRKKTWQIDNQTWTPEDVACEILKKAASYIREEVGCDNEIKAVVTVPAIFSSAACQATKSAAIKAGINCLEVIAEPVAAAYAYSEINLEQTQTLVIDIGGGTFDLAIVNSMYKSVECVDGDNELGGDDFDKAIMENFLVPCIGSVSEQIKDEVLEIAKDIKEQLQESSIDRINIAKNLSNGQNIDVTVTKQEYIDSCHELNSKMAGALYRIINKNCSFDKVLLVGGMAKDPNIIKLIESIPELACKFEGRPPEDYMSMVSIGAALHCWEKSNGGTGVLNTITFTDIGIASLRNGELVFSPIIKSGTSITDDAPACGVHTYINNENISVLNIKIYESLGSRDLNECQHYRDYHIHIPPCPKGEYRFNIRMSLDVNRILTVSDDKNQLLQTFCLEEDQF